MQQIFRPGIPGKKLPSTHRADLLHPTFSLPFTIGHLERAKPEQLPVHTQPGLELVTVVSGIGTQYIDGCYYTMEPGDICFVNGMVSHALATSANFKSVYVHLNDEAILSIYPRDLGLSILRLFYLPLTQGTTNVLAAQNASSACLCEALKAFQNGGFGIMNAWGNIVKVLADIASVVVPLQTPDSETESINQQKIFTAVEFLHHHYPNDKLSMEEVANSCAMSSSHFSHIFSKIMHFSPNEYLNKIRINHALEQITSTSKKMETIAYDCGFSYLSSFYHHFKKITGKSPQTFRKSKKQE